MGGKLTAIHGVRSRNRDAQEGQVGTSSSVFGPHTRTIPFHPFLSRIGRKVSLALFCKFLLSGLDLASHHFAFDGFVFSHSE